MKTKTLTIACAAVLCAGTGLARPCGPRHPGGFHRPPPIHCHGWHHPPRHHGVWGPGGRYFWPGFVGGVVGGALATTVLERDTVVVQPATTVVTTPVVTTPVVTTPVVTTPVVVQQPVVVSQPVQQTRNVWVEGRYVDQVQANGSTVRVWQPGHYEQQTVLAP